MNLLGVRRTAGSSRADLPVLRVDRPDDHRRLAREFVGGGLPQATWKTATVPIGHGAGTLIASAAILTLARAFANGGSSLTGIEAISNAVSTLRPPEGRNAGGSSRSRAPS